MCGDIQKSTFASGAVSRLWHRTPDSPDTEEAAEGGGASPKREWAREHNCLCGRERESVCYESITEGYTIFVKLGLTAIFNSFLGAESKTDLSFSITSRF